LNYPRQRKKRAPYPEIRRLQEKLEALGPLNIQQQNQFFVEIDNILSKSPFIDTKFELSPTENKTTFTMLKDLISTRNNNPKLRKQPSTGTIPSLTKWPHLRDVHRSASFTRSISNGKKVSL
jgi:hypothetical protein